MANEAREDEDAEVECSSELRDPLGGFPAAKLRRHALALRPYTLCLESMYTRQTWKLRTINLTNIDLTASTLLELTKQYYFLQNFLDFFSQTGTPSTIGLTPSPRSLAQYI